MVRISDTFIAGGLVLGAFPSYPGSVTISRAAGTFTYPGSFMLVVSLNPCPCGYRGTRSTECRCDDGMVERYLAKVSGPLLDRIDLQIEVARVPFEEIVKNERAESSNAIRERVMRARMRQVERYRGTPFIANGDIPGSQVRVHCALDEAGNALLKAASATRKFSARAFDRIARVARTIADLAGDDHIRAEHVAEAIMYRSLERLGRAA